MATEVGFLRQNAQRWQRFEALLDGSAEEVSPDELTELFVEVTDDLSYASTFFPKSRTAAYLNDLATRAHRSIYRTRKEDRSRFKRFWAEEVPLAVYACRRELLLSLLFFSLAVLLGVVSALNDDGFTRLILGDSYVNLTLENVSKGDPLAIYKKEAEIDMFLGITINNILVSFNTFASGILFSVGTVRLLFANGVMLGSFHTLFFQHGLLLKSLLVVYIHGTLEISAIIIAGGAGLTMGNSFLFPGTYSRIESLRRGARRGMKVAVGLVPIFVMAGFSEGFVTRYTGMPVALSLAIILGSLGFILWYFAYLPGQVKRKYAHDA